MTQSSRLRPSVRYRIATLPQAFVRDRDRSESAEGTRLLDAIRPSILRALTAERADAYVTILAKMLALRRTGTLAPTLDELRQQLSGAIADESAFLRDLLQLEEWGCLTLELEPQSIRGYRDARRERFRHRLTEDAIALLEWLEARLARRATPLLADANDRLLDVLDRARELVRLTHHEPPSSVDGGRRAQHLVRSVDAELDTVTRTLVDLHAEMRRFACRTFEPRSLERLVSGLEAYVAGFLRSVGERRRDLGDAIAQLTETQACERLTELARVGEEHRGPFSLPDAAESSVTQSLTRWRGFLEDGGELDDHCAQIEAATHDVIAKLRGRLVALERRGDRAHERACAIHSLATIDDTREGALAMWGFGRPTWAPGDGGRLLPPLPRRKTRARVEQPRALPIKVAPREVVREPRQKRLKRVAEWLREAGLTDRGVQLSQARHDLLRGVEAPAAWIVVARAQHLGRGAGLSELGVRIEPTGGVVTIGNETVGLTSPDCVVSGLDLDRGARLARPTQSCRVRSADDSGRDPDQGRRP